MATDLGWDVGRGEGGEGGEGGWEGGKGGRGGLEAPFVKS